MRSISTDFRSGSRWPRSWTRPCWERNGRTADDDRVCASHTATSIAIKVDLCPYPTGYHSSRIALIQTLLFLEEEDRRATAILNSLDGWNRLVGVPKGRRVDGSKWGEGHRQQPYLAPDPVQETRMEGHGACQQVPAACVASLVQCRRMDMGSHNGTLATEGRQNRLVCTLGIESTYFQTCLLEETRYRRNLQSKLPFALL